MWGDFKHERRRAVVGSRIDEDDEDDEADDTDTDEEEEGAGSHRGLICRVAALKAAGKEDEPSAGIDWEGAIGCVVAVKELDKEEGSSIMTVRLVLRLVFSGIPYEER